MKARFFNMANLYYTILIPLAIDLWHVQHMSLEAVRFFSKMDIWTKKTRLFPAFS